MTTNTSRKPTHAVFHVRGEGERAFWTKIGAAWLHEDKEGLNVSLDYVPLNDAGRLVIRVNKAEDGKPAAEGEGR